MTMSRSRTSLSNANDVMALENGRDTVRLNGRRHFVFAEFNVFQHDRVEAGIFKLRG